MSSCQTEKVYFIILLWKQPLTKMFGYEYNNRISNNFDSLCVSLEIILTLHNIDILEVNKMYLSHNLILCSGVLCPPYYETKEFACVMCT